MSIYHGGLGWASYVDGDYSSGTPQVISGSRTILELDATTGSALETDLPRGYSSLWDSVNDKFTPNAEGDAYDVRVNFIFDRTAGGDDSIDLQLDIGGSQGIIWEQSIARLKGTQRHSVSVPFFCGSTFLANGGTFYIEPNASTWEFYGMSILVIAHYQRGRIHA